MHYVKRLSSFISQCDSGDALHRRYQHSWRCPCRSAVAVDAWLLATLTEERTWHERCLLRDAIKFLHVASCTQQCRFMMIHQRCRFYFISYASLHGAYMNRCVLFLVPQSMQWVYRWGSFACVLVQLYIHVVVYRFVSLWCTSGVICTCT